jgi:hypothetical protein
MGSMTRVSTLRPSRLAECPDHDARGRGPQPHKATGQTMTQGGYLLWLRRPRESGDDGEDHDRCHVAQDS